MCCKRCWHSAILMCAGNVELRHSLALYAAKEHIKRVLVFVDNFLNFRYCSILEDKNEKTGSATSVIGQPCFLKRPFHHVI